jgi:hypothetical protein
VRCPLSANRAALPGACAWRPSCCSAAVFSAALVPAAGPSSPPSAKVAWFPPDRGVGKGRLEAVVRQRAAGVRIQISGPAGGADCDDP